MNFSNILNYLVIFVFSISLLYYLFVLKYYCFPSDTEIIFRKFVFKEKLMALVKIGIVALFIFTANTENILTIISSTLACLVFSISIINDNLIVRTKDYLYINSFKVPIKNIKDVESSKSGKLLKIKISYNLKEKKFSKSDKVQLEKLKKSGDKNAIEKLIKEELKNLVIQELTLDIASGDKLVKSLNK